MAAAPAVLVRTHDPSGTLAVIEGALGSAPGAVHDAHYVCVGDIIDVDDQVGDASEGRGHGPWRRAC